MAGPENTPDSSAFGRLLHSEARFLSRVTAVLRFEPAVYEEIEKDPYAIPQAFAVVIATALLAGLGQGSLAAIFLGIALAILIWAGVTGLVWGVGVLVAGPASHFPSLLRCLGFAYIWVGLLIGSGLPSLPRIPGAGNASGSPNHHGARDPHLGPRSGLPLAHYLVSRGRWLNS
jgi:hypothetical protein